ncbi:MAG TPA: hypothetical protein VMY87_06305 [Armatimonadota bacterium]|nr:hypothetical protein [Armatimonadota bacterium]
MIERNAAGEPITLSVRQTQAFETLEDPTVKEVLYGGAKGGGKSVLGCVWVAARALEIIEEFQLEPRKYPIPIGFMGRAVGTDFGDTTLETWKEQIPGGLYTIKEQAHEVIIGGAVAIHFGGFDRTEAVNKFNSAEFAFIFIDQAEELVRRKGREDPVALLRATLRRKIGGRHPKYKALWTANPRQGWLKDEFVEGKDPERRFIQALPSDNPNLPPDYVRTLEKAFAHRPELLEAYLHGSWDAFASDDQLVRESWLRAAEEQTRYYATERVLVTCDPARFGDDETACYVLSEAKILKTLIYGKKDLVYTANNLHILAHEAGGCLIVVDEAGLGSGVVDILRDMGDEVLGVNSQAASSDARYGNLRAEIWDTVAQMFAAGDVDTDPLDAQLKAQLCCPTYKFKRGRMYVEEKDEIKARLGRSPDEADAYVMGLWALQYARPVAKGAKAGRRRHRMRPAMAT